MGNSHDAEMRGMICELRKNRVFDGLCVDCPKIWKVYKDLICEIDGGKRSPDQVCQMDKEGIRTMKACDNCNYEGYSGGRTDEHHQTLKEAAYLLAVQRMTHAQLKALALRLIGYENYDRQDFQSAYRVVNDTQSMLTDGRVPGNKHQYTEPKLAKQIDNLTEA